MIRYNGVIVYKDKKLKYTKRLPFRRTRHCSTVLNDTTIFIFGGNDQLGQDGMGMKKGIYLYHSEGGRQAYDGYFLTVEDPKHPEDYRVTHFPDQGLFPCLNVNNRLPVRCALRLNENDQKAEMGAEGGLLGFTQYTSVNSLPVNRSCRLLEPLFKDYLDFLLNMPAG